MISKFICYQIIQAITSFYTILQALSTYENMYFHYLQLQNVKEYQNIVIQQVVH